MTITQEALTVLAQTVEDKFKGNLAEASDFFGIKYQTLYSWLRKKDRTPKLAVMEPALERLNVTLKMPDNTLKEFDLVAKVKARPGAGASLEVSDEVSGYYAFRQDFMGRLNLHAKKCVLMDVIGDSMTPTIADGDTVLIDQSDKELRDRQIYVVTLFDELRIKRLQKTFDGVDLVSDNRTIEPIHVRGEDIDRLVIHGRVRWVGKCL